MKGKNPNSLINYLLLCSYLFSLQSETLVKDVTKNVAQKIKIMMRGIHPLLPNMHTFFKKYDMMGDGPGYDWWYAL